ncbi:hypothetical protein OFD71_38185, partial [Escherichia coli]|nr:hypothetical protein [Escherichia coli]
HGAAASKLVAIAYMKHVHVYQPNYVKLNQVASQIAICTATPLLKLRFNNKKTLAKNKNYTGENYEQTIRRTAD